MTTNSCRFTAVDALAGAPIASRFSKGLASVERHVALLLLERQFFVRARRFHGLPAWALLDENIEQCTLQTSCCTNTAFTTSECPETQSKKTYEGSKETERTRQREREREREREGERQERWRELETAQNTKAGLTLLDTMEMKELEDFNEGPIQRSAGSPYWRELL